MLSIGWMMLLGMAAQAQEQTVKTMHISGQHEDREHGLDCASDPCALALPGAVRFEPIPDKPYAQGFDADGEALGWVVLSDDVVKIKAYSGKPMFTLVGLDPDAKIVGARVIHHSEPILLVGIPEQELHDFVDGYVGLAADAKVIVGGEAEDATSFDAISGATVTVLAQSQTIMSAASRVAVDLGLIASQESVEGHFIERSEPLSWSELKDDKVFGRLQVSFEEAERTPGGEHAQFLDVHFGIIDSPQVGTPILGERTFKWAKEQLAEGEHLLALLNAGEYSIRGSGFVRGGIFDRFRIIQGLESISFRDLDYTKIPQSEQADIPTFWEGGLFVIRDGAFNPALTYELELLTSRFDTSKGGFARTFRTFSRRHRVPRSVYELHGPDPEAEAAARIWKSAWRTGWKKALFVGLRKSSYTLSREPSFCKSDGFA